jgi:hypothetical protein
MNRLYVAVFRKGRDIDEIEVLEEEKAAATGVMATARTAAGATVGTEVCCCGS